MRSEPPRPQPEPQITSLEERRMQDEPLQVRSTDLLDVRRWGRGLLFPSARALPQVVEVQDAVVAAADEGVRVLVVVPFVGISRGPLFRGPLIISLYMYVIGQPDLTKCVCVHIYIYIYMYTYIHTYVCIYIRPDKDIQAYNEGSCGCTFRHRLNGLLL